jgi:hypothetical protein
MTMKTTSKTWMQTAEKVNRTERGMWGVYEGTRLIVKADTREAAEKLAATVRAFGTGRERVTVHYLA